MAVADKSNEVTAFPLLRQLELKGCLVTIDAMGCQMEIVGQVLAREADYVLAFKENQPTLYDEVQDSFALARASYFAEFAAGEWDHWQQVNKGHGRLEIRDHWVLADPQVLTYLRQAAPWPGSRAIGLSRPSAAGAMDPASARRATTC